MKINFLQKKPFYIFEIEDFLKDEEYEILNKNFPEVSKEDLIKSKGLKYSFTNYSNLYQSKKNNECIKLLEEIFNEVFFIKLINKIKKEILISRITKIPSVISLFRKIKLSTEHKNKNFFQKFLYSYFRYTFEFSYMYKNSYIAPHTDSTAKMISLMLYFPNKELENQAIGTTFYESTYKHFENKQPDLFLEENSNFFQKHFKETFTFPYKKKNLYCFIKSDMSWHSVKPLNIPEDQIRKSININVNI